MNDKGKVSIEGLDIFDILKFTKTKSRKFIRMGLEDFEAILGKDSSEFKAVRKVFLDITNDYTRSLLRLFFGDVERLQYDPTSDRRTEAQ